MKNRTDENIKHLLKEIETGFSEAKARDQYPPRLTKEEKSQLRTIYSKYKELKAEYKNGVVNEDIQDELELLYKKINRIVPSDKSKNSKTDSVEKNINSDKQYTTEQHKQSFLTPNKTNKQWNDEPIFNDYQLAKDTLNDSLKRMKMMRIGLFISILATIITICMIKYHQMYLSLSVVLISIASYIICGGFFWMISKVFSISKKVAFWGWFIVPFPFDIPTGLISMLIGIIYLPILFILCPAIIIAIVYMKERKIYLEAKQYFKYYDDGNSIKNPTIKEALMEPLSTGKKMIYSSIIAAALLSLGLLWFVVALVTNFIDAKSAMNTAQYQQVENSSYEATQTETVEVPDFGTVEVKPFEVAPFGENTNNKQNNNTTQEETIEEDVPVQKIEKISDISQKDMDKMIEYTKDDLVAELAEKVDNKPDERYVNTIYDRYLFVRGGQRISNWESWDGKDRRVLNRTLSEPELFKIVLLGNKSDPKKGTLRINYQIHHQAVAPNEVHDRYSGGISEETFEIDEYIYYSYYYTINLENIEMPVDDYYKFTQDRDNTDSDYDNWYNKNIVKYKGDYLILDEIDY